MKVIRFKQKKIQRFKTLCQKHSNVKLNQLLTNYRETHPEVMKDDFKDNTSKERSQSKSKESFVKSPKELFKQMFRMNKEDDIDG